MATTYFGNGTYNYINYMQNLNSPQLREIMLVFLKANGLSTRLGAPHTEGSLVRKAKRSISQLPQVHSAAIGQAVQMSTFAPFQDYTETVGFFRDAMEWDKAWLNDKNYVTDVVQKQIKLYFQARSFALDNTIINNYQGGSGPIADGELPNGIKYRIAFPGPTSGGGTGSGVNPGCDIYASADLSFAAGSTTGAIKLGYDIETICSHMGNDMGTNMLMVLNPQAWRLLNATVKLAGTAGGFSIAKDAFGRHIMKWSDLEIVSCGWLPPQDSGLQVAPIIESYQDANGWVPTDTAYNANAVQPNTNISGNNFTSIYFIQTGKDMFSLWQQDEAFYKYWPQIPGQWYGEALLEQSLGIWQPDTHSIGRIKGVRINGQQYD